MLWPLMKIKLLLLSALVVIWLPGCVTTEDVAQRLNLSKQKNCVMGCADPELIIPPIINDRPTQETQNARINPR